MRLYSSLKKAFLHLSKWLGLFELARSWIRNGLRILCYHGFTLSDERCFRPSLFIDLKTFEKRLEFLAAKHFPVLPLGQALDLLDQRKLPSGATVITIDDGFYSVYEYAARLLQRFSFPSTLYVTSYYSIKEDPVFRLAVQYMFWKTGHCQFDLSALGIGLSGCISLEDKKKKDQAMWEIIRYGETHCEQPERSVLAETLGKHLGVGYGDIVRNRCLSLIDRREIQFLLSTGMDIQLHTHRHRFPEDEVLATREITDNKAELEPVVGKPLRHFSYPSGLWSYKQWPWLTNAGIWSATTCMAGLNYPETPRLALRRFLDSENISQIEFEAEVYGFSEILRRTRTHMQRFLRWKSTASVASGG